MNPSKREKLFLLKVKWNEIGTIYWKITTANSKEEAIGKAYNFFSEKVKEWKKRNSSHHLDFNFTIEKCIELNCLNDLLNVKELMF